MSDIRGPKGEQGPDGAQGRDGKQGLRGTQGRDGEVGQVPATSESRTDCNLTLDPGDFTILDVSEAYCQATLTTRALIGRRLFEAFKDNPLDPTANGVENLRASLERVKATGRLDAMGIQRYDIIRPASLGNGYEARWWKVINSPIFEHGRLVAIVHHVEDRTQTELNRRATVVQSQRITQWLVRAGVFMGFVVVGLIVAVLASNSLAHRLANQIQAQRVHSIWRACDDQNMRNAKTLGELAREVELARKALPSPTSVQIDASARNAAALINDLAPYQDCSAVVFKATGVRLDSTGRP